MFGDCLLFPVMDIINNMLELAGGKLAIPVQASVLPNWELSLATMTLFIKDEHFVYEQLS